jgi:hypothetical protein
LRKSGANSVIPLTVSQENGTVHHLYFGSGSSSIFWFFRGYQVMKSIV